MTSKTYFNWKLSTYTTILSSIRTQKMNKISCLSDSISLELFSSFSWYLWSLYLFLSFCELLDHFFVKTIRIKTKDPNSFILSAIQGTNFSGTSRFLLKYAFHFSDLYLPALARKKPKATRGVTQRPNHTH